MKKLLMLLSLTLATSTFASLQSNSEQSATMNINAIVIKPLTIEKIADMEFGSIIQGNKANATSAYSIKGEAGQGITVTVDNSVLLQHENTNSTMTVGIRTAPPHSLNKDGNATLSVDGILETAQNQEVGKYTGTLVAKVQYN
ncbi:DUF4402 domain-containing protein [Cetobacterium sp.]|uniref:DUF4402 domain-containing protein n=1 Tax=Cetobacterium sp. TaxID=2071632 RepID=UPI003F383BC9